MATSPAPIYLVTQADLELALTGEKVKQLGADRGQPEARAAWVKLVLESGQGEVLGQVQRAVKLGSVYEQWVANWTDLDKANLRRMVLSACLYYAHLYGQKGEEVPEDIRTEHEAIMAQATAIGDHLGTLANEPTAQSSTQHAMLPNLAAGHNACGFPRSYWRDF